MHELHRVGDLGAVHICFPPIPPFFFQDHTASLHVTLVGPMLLPSSVPPEKQVHKPRGSIGSSPRFTLGMLGVGCLFLSDHNPQKRCKLLITISLPLFHPEGGNTVEETLTKAKFQRDDWSHWIHLCLKLISYMSQ